MSLHSVLFAPDSSAVDSLVAELYERGTSGIIEEGTQIRAFFEDEAEYCDLLGRYPILEMRSEPIAPSVPEGLPCEPICVGRKFFITPASYTEDSPEGRYRLVLNDSAAFGTGRHETTQLMLGALEEIVGEGDIVVDIGTGTGILAQAARLLGAKHVWACDIYEYGVRMARDIYGLEMFAGSADALREGIADITLANITPHILDSIAGDLKRVTAPGGRLLISGFLRGGEPSRFKPDASWEQDGWICWLCRPGNINAPLTDGRKVIIHPQEWW